MVMFLSIVECPATGLRDELSCFISFEEYASSKDFDWTATAEWYHWEYLLDTENLSTLS